MSLQGTSQVRNPNNSNAGCTLSLEVSWKPKHTGSNKNTSHYHRTIGRDQEVDNDVGRLTTPWTRGRECAAVAELRWSRGVVKGAAEACVLAVNPCAPPPVGCAPTGNSSFFHPVCLLNNVVVFCVAFTPQITKNITQKLFGLTLLLSSNKQQQTPTFNHSWHQTA